MPEDADRQHSCQTQMHTVKHLPNFDDNKKGLEHFPNFDDNQNERNNKITNVRTRISLGFYLECNSPSSWAVQDLRLQALLN